MPEKATKFPCPYLNSEVELTSEREQHIAENHPDLLPAYRSSIVETLADLDEVRRSLQLSNVFLFSKRYDVALGGKNIVIVVMSGSVGKPRNWIVTGYRTRKLVAGETVWKKN